MAQLWRKLEDIIRNVLVKQMKVPKPKFTAKANTIQGAIQRENWIIETMLDNLMASMSEEDRMEFARIVAEELAKEGVTLDPNANMALASGGLFALRKTLGFKFHIYVAKIANTVVKFITGKGLSIPANALLQKIVGQVFGKFIPVVGVISLIWTITDIPGLINPRNYDKYIPAVFMLGLSRLSQNNM